MNVRQAQRFSMMLWVWNGIALLALVTFGIKWGVDWFMNEPQQVDRLADLPLPSERKSARAEMTVEKLRGFWECNILQEKPKLPVVEKKLEKPKLNAPPAMPPAFEWVAVMVHSIPERSQGILLDKKNGEQILIKVGMVLPGTQYHVTEITATSIRVVLGENIFTLRKPEPASVNGKTGKKDAGSESLFQEQVVQLKKK